MVYQKQAEVETFTTSTKVWPNARNISTQLLTILLHDVATCVKWAGQTHAAFSTFLTQHVAVYVPQAPGTQQVDLVRMVCCSSCVNVAKPVQHHTTSKMLHEKLDRFQI